MINIEIRHLVIRAREMGKSVKEISQLYNVRRASVYNLLRLHRETGSVEARPHSFGRKPALDAEGLRALEQLVDRRPNITLKEIREELKLQISLAAICKILKRKLGYRYRNHHRQRTGATDTGKDGQIPETNAPGI